MPTASRDKLTVSVLAPTSFCTRIDFALLFNSVLVLVHRGELAGLPDVPKVVKGHHVCRSYLKDHIVGGFGFGPKPISCFEVGVEGAQVELFPILGGDFDVDERAAKRLRLGTRGDTGTPVQWRMFFGVEPIVAAAAFSCLVVPDDDAAPTDGPGAPVAIRIRVSLLGIVLAEIDIDRPVSPMWVDSSDSVSRGAYQHIFASYAREDRAFVECFESVLHNLGLGELRWDLKVLRAGARWEEAVFEEIGRADSFQLFWSSHARSSENVRKEWRHALGLGRDRFIKPVYWEDPLPDPPPELGDIHFGRIFIPAGFRRPSPIGAAWRWIRGWRGR